MARSEPNVPTDKSTIEIPGNTWWIQSRVLVPALVLTGCFLMLFELGGYRTLTKHESFVAVVSQEMLLTGDFVVPRFRNLPRLKKPPLAYWLAAGSAAVAGVHNELTARLPSALAALLLAALIGCWAARWYGRKAGYAAALVQLSCAWVISFGRKAEVDMVLCLLTTSALFLIAHYDPQQTRWRRFQIVVWVWLLIALSWLAKFHYGPAMVLSVAGAWFLFRRWWWAFVDALNPVGLLLFAAAVVVWPYLLLQKVPSAWTIWQTETVGRALGELGREPFWFYLPQLFAQTLPWSPWLIAAIPYSYRRAWRSFETVHAGPQTDAPRSSDSHEAGTIERNQRREQFLWIWVVVQLVILTASAFKHHHYLMAALPAFSLLLGRQLASAVTSLGTRGFNWSKGRTAGTFAALVPVLVAIPFVISRKWPHLQAAAISLVLILGLGLFCTFWALSRQRIRQGLSAAAAASLLGYAILMGVIFPARDRRLPVVRFASKVTQQTETEPHQVCVFGLKEDPLVYYLRRTAFRVESLDNLRDELHRNAGLWVVAKTSDLPRLKELGDPRVIEQVQTYDDCPPAKGPPLSLYRLTPHRLASQ